MAGAYRGRDVAQSNDQDRINRKGFKVMNEVEYYAMQEGAELGKAIAEIAKAFFSDAETMAELARDYYRSVDYGPAISFELHDGQRIYVGSELARTMDKPWLAIRSIGVSSIVEGSDAEVPLQWLDLLPYAEMEDGPKKAIEAFDAMVNEVNAEACQSDDQDRINRKGPQTMIEITHKAEDDGYLRDVLRQIKQRLKTLPPKSTEAQKLTRRAQEISEMIS
jgi:hypothetical protein